MPSSRLFLVYLKCISAAGSMAAILLQRGLDFAIDFPSDAIALPPFLTPLMAFPVTNCPGPVGPKLILLTGPGTPGFAAVGTIFATAGTDGF